MLQGDIPDSFGRIGTKKRFFDTITHFSIIPISIQELPKMHATEQFYIWKLKPKVNDIKYVWL